MRTIKVHVPSAVVGSVLAVLVLLSMSQSAPPAGPPRIEYGPHPRDMVQIRQGTAFVVPSSKVFVLTGLGSVNGGECTLQVNGQAEVTGGWEMQQLAAPEFSTVAPVPTGFTVAAGGSIEVNSVPGIGRAWGYLADVH